MRTQSVDTHPQAERIMVELIRNSPMSRRFRLVQSLTHSTFRAPVQTWRERQREASDQEAAVHVLSCFYGPGLAQRMQAALERCEGWHLQPIDLLAVMLPARRTLEDLCVPYYLGGSIASSLHGLQQLAQDIDLVVDLDEQTFPSLCAALGQHYLFDEDEAFLTNSLWEIMPLTRLNQHTIRNGKIGRITAKLMQRYQQEMVGTQQVAIQRLVFELFMPTDTPETYENRIRPFLLGVPNNDANALGFLMKHLPDELFTRMKVAQPTDIDAFFTNLKNMWLERRPSLFNYGSANTMNGMASQVPQQIVQQPSTTSTNYKSSNI